MNYGGLQFTSKAHEVLLIAPNGECHLDHNTTREGHNRGEPGGTSVLTYQEGPTPQHGHTHQTKVMRYTKKVPLRKHKLIE